MAAPEHDQLGSLRIPLRKPGFSEIYNQWPPVFLNRFVKSSQELRFPPRPTLAHPWTGEMNATQWFKFAALHHWMHRVHADRIVDGLK